MRGVARLGRALAVAAAVGLAAVGCGGDDGNPANNNGNNNNIGGSVPIEKWMTKNLDVETDGGSWCYDDDPANCDKYGRLYTWEAAKSACQLVGMRLPTREEWDALVTASGGENTAGKKLKSRNGWYNNGNGTDDFGFSALPGGSRLSNGYFHNAGNAGSIGVWWEATEDGSYAYGRYMSYDGNGVNKFGNGKDYGYSVRCVQD